MPKFNEGEKVRFIGYNDPYSRGQEWKIGDTATVIPGEIFEDWIRVKRDRDDYQAGYPEVSFESFSESIGDRVQFIGYNDPFSKQQGWEIGDTATVISSGLRKDGGDPYRWLNVRRDRDGYSDGYPAMSFKFIPNTVCSRAPEKHLNRYQIIMEEDLI